MDFFFSFLATGDSYHTMNNRYRVGGLTIHKAVRETCDVIWDVLAQEEIPVPTREDWIRIRHEFNKRWQFLNCLSALDGKHIITSPANTGSLYHNYRETFSINLMALVNANYQSPYLDVGNYGSNADGTFYFKSTFGQLYLSHELDIPGPKSLPNEPQFGNLPHVIVVDEAFPLKPNILRPYPQFKNVRRLSHPKQIYNYWLSRACHIVENDCSMMEV